MDVTILVAASRGPSAIIRLLDSLDRDPSVRTEEVTVGIVDNRADRAIVAAAESLARAREYRVWVVHEPRAGADAARNRGLDELTSSTDVVVFLDDDEVVEAGWYRALVGGLDRLGADVVVGPVIPVVEAGDEWVLQQELFHDRERPDGTMLDTAPTNNTAVRRSVLGQSRFDAWRTGGDTAFFAALHDRGAVIRWAADALVSEHVDRHRRTVRYVLQRRYWHGITRGAVERRRVARSRRIRCALAGAWHLAAGMVTAIAGTFRRRRIVLRGVGRSVFGAGIIVGLVLGDRLLRLTPASTPHHQP